VHCIGGDDCGYALIAYGENDLSEQALDFDLNDRAEQLIASTDAGRTRVGGCSRQEFIKRFCGNAMVAAGRLHRLNAAGQYPVLESRIADADACRCLARREQVGWGGGGHRTEILPSGVLYTVLQSALTGLAKALGTL
jgi:hypothetical protein